MNAVTKQLKCLLAISYFLFAGAGAGLAQQVSSAKNFAGLGGSILWNTTGISAGVSGERIIISKHNTELSLKASHTFRHRFGNLILLFGSPYDISSAETGLGVSWNWFTGSRKVNTGFFLSAGAGGMYSHWKFDSGGSSTYLRPAGELGFGLKGRLNDKMAIKWSNDIKWASPQPDGGGAVITTTTLALGF